MFLDKSCFKTDHPAMQKETRNAPDFTAPKEEIFADKIPGSVFEKHILP